MTPDLQFLLSDVLQKKFASSQTPHFPSAIGLRDSCSKHFSCLLCSLTSCKLCTGPGGVATGGYVAPTPHTHSALLGTSCRAGPWPAARAGPGLPTGIYRPAGEADIIRQFRDGSIYAGLHSQAFFGLVPITPLFLFVAFKKK
jgi:hypothetical protein